MLKLIGITQRDPDRPVGDVIRYWQDVHAQIAGRSPEVRGCIVPEVLLTGGRRHPGGRVHRAVVG